MMGSRGRKNLEMMQNNPLDWRIDDVKTVCAAYGISCENPRKGSHYTVSHRTQAEILTIPAHRPIKPVYIRKLVSFVNAVEGSSQ